MYEIYHKTQLIIHVHVYKKLTLFYHKYPAGYKKERIQKFPWIHHLKQNQMKLLQQKYPLWGFPSASTATTQRQDPIAFFSCLALICEWLSFISPVDLGLCPRNLYVTTRMVNVREFAAIENL
jgi:hypothetical protein